MALRKEQNIKFDRRNDAQKMPSEQKIKHAVDIIFSKYDVDKNGFLEFSEIKTVVNDAFKNNGSPRNIQEADVKSFVSVLDTDSDGTISKDELFLIFKKLITEAHQKNIVKF